MLILYYCCFVFIFCLFNNSFIKLNGVICINYYNEINRNVKNYSINRSDLNIYYNVGKMLSEADKHYCEEIIKEYSRKLTLELEKCYIFTSLTRMKKFYMLIKKKLRQCRNNYYILIIVK